ncbi:hypothetical protein [Haliangium ochraceum]|uniref:IcmF-related N-terminal domain-containing protein n=1 Tax=Haliangium ochraceum (strain DSM 14365 / JCM 11303 / SMP-2) TaxID=502025 RepID=D0LR51_HALO1|nr:hypothetical protein [Haliangium ochraceum]ACY15559.1 hypothetical protein Hoch_3053 [Haliangium ochraceum DSM 14365]
MQSPENNPAVSAGGSVDAGAGASPAAGSSGDADASAAAGAGTAVPDPAAPAPAAGADAPAAGADPAGWPWETILWIAGGVLLLIVLVVAAVLLWRWWQRRQRQAPAEPAAPALSERLEQVWKPFYRELPPAARHYPTVVVLGHAGAGKSQLIDSHVDWRGQENQYLHSAVNGGPLQLYLGPEVVVHELSTGLLGDLSRQARRALTKLWRRVGPSVIVVVALDGRRLAGASEDELRRLAQLVRGKIGLLPRRVRGAVRLRVCITHLDASEGYAEFAQLAGTHPGELRLEALGPGYDDASAWLAAYEPHLSYALTRRSAPEFARFVRFLEALPVLVRQFAPLARSLAGEDPFAPRYRLDELSLSALLPASSVGEPFAVDRAQVAASLAESRRRHLYYSAAMAVVALAAVTGLHVWHVGRLHDAEDAVRALAQNRVTLADTRPSMARDATASAVDAASERLLFQRARAAGEAIDAVRDSEILWLGRVFEDRKDALALAFTDAVRDKTLLPLVSRGDERVRLLYAVSLIYAARSTELGALINETPAPWVQRLRLPETLVRDYLRASEQPWDGLVTLPALPAGGDDGGEGEGDWSAYFEHLRAIYQADALSPAALAAAQASAPLLTDAQEYALLAEAAAALPADPVLLEQLAPLLDSLSRSTWVRENYGQLSALTSMVADTDLSVRATPGWTLGMLLDELVRLSEGAAPGEDVYRFALDGRDYAFARASWADMAARARAGALIRGVLGDIEAAQRSPFFRADAFLPGVAPAAAGLGASRGIRGVYTRQAFAEHVAPVLAQTQPVLDQAALDAADASTLSSYVLASADSYARAYREELSQYYQSFRFEVAQPASLPYALRAFTGAPSWFTDFLHVVATTASPPLGEGSFFVPMASNLQPFAALVALLAEDQGSFPNLAPHAQIVAALVSALEAGGAAGADAGAAGGDAAAEQDGLRSELSAVGALVLDVLSGNGDSHVAQTRAWLASTNLDRSFHEPFLAPVEEAYALGREDIEAAVQRLWQREVLPVALPLLSRFPFDEAADRGLTPDELEAALRAQGKQPGGFWQAFDALVGPATARARDGGFRMLSPLRPPAGMLRQLDALAALSERLWDADGKRVAFVVQVTPLPLPREAAAGRVPTLAYLKAGSAGVYAFNQQPSAQALAVDWWAADAASVGLQLTAPASASKRHVSVEVAAQSWSFWDLLRRAQVSGETWSWEIPVSADETSRRAVRFAFDEDPFDVFDVPQSARSSALLSPRSSAARGAP